jgi:hypothetical protein
MFKLWGSPEVHPSETLMDNRYLSLPDGSIKTMDRLEEVFLKRWSIKEDPNMLLTD